MGRVVTGNDNYSKLIRNRENGSPRHTGFIHIEKHDLKDLT